MYKRTFSISYITLDDLKEMKNFYGINKATFSRMAVYHGIKQLKSGYVPVRKKQKGTKRKFDIELPEETWAEFNKAMEILGERTKEHIPDGEMIDIFLNIELKKFIGYYKKNEEIYEKRMEKENGNLSEYTQKIDISVNMNMPELLYEFLEDKRRKINIKQIQLVKYLMLSSSIQEYNSIRFDTLDTDADLINEIEMLRLDRQKALTLIRYLIANERIVWKIRE